MRWLRRLPWLRGERLRWLQRLRRLQSLSLRRRLRRLRRRLRWVRRWLDRRGGGMRRVLCIMGSLPLVLDNSAP